MYWKALGAAFIAAAATLHAHAGALTSDTHQLHDWVLKSHDHHGHPFAIVDKKHASIFVFDASGRLRGDSAALIGQAAGDESAPDVGEHAQQGEVPFAERTTPAGRFGSAPGVNASGEPVIWVDYDSAFAIHRLRPGRSFKAREARLANGTPAERRVSYGCVVVPVRFYEDVVQRWLGNGRAVVYVLPESGSAREISNPL
jgi:hypothetical protein